jgi:hypothetical protein
MIVHNIFLWRDKLSAVMRQRPSNYNETCVVEADTEFFWASFRTSAEGVPMPKQFAAGARYNIEAGITYISGTDADTAGKLVEAFKRTDPDDVRYLVEAGFYRDTSLEVPAVEDRRLARR